MFSIASVCSTVRGTLLTLFVRTLHRYINKCPCSQLSLHAYYVWIMVWVRRGASLLLQDRPTRWTDCTRARASSPVRPRFDRPTWPIQPSPSTRDRLGGTVQLVRLTVQPGPSHLAIQLGPSDVPVQLGPSHVGVKLGPSDLAVQLGPSDLAVQQGRQIWPSN